MLTAMVSVYFGRTVLTGPDGFYPLLLTRPPLWCTLSPVITRAVPQKETFKASGLATNLHMVVKRDAASVHRERREESISGDVTEGRSMSLRNAAQAYVGYGWALVPLVAPGKRPDGDLLQQVYGQPTTWHLPIAPASAQEVELWFRLKPEINLGVYPSGCLALVDIDRLDVLNPEIPAPTASSGRDDGGRHLYLSCDRLLPTRKTKWGDLNPSHLVLPGSLHETGRRYEWLEGLSPAEVPLMDYREALPLLGLEAW